MELHAIVVAVGDESGRFFGPLEFEHLPSHGDADVGVAAGVVIPVVADFFSHTVVVELEGHLVRAVGFVGIDHGNITNKLWILFGVADGELTLHNGRFIFNHTAACDDEG